MCYNKMVAIWGMEVKGEVPEKQLCVDLREYYNMLFPEGPGGC
jgi:hypothetical protein